MNGMVTFCPAPQTPLMKAKPDCYHRYCFPHEIISYTIRLCHRFSLSFRDVDDLLAKRGIIVSYESISQCCCRLDPSPHKCSSVCRVGSPENGTGTRH